MLAEWEQKFPGRVESVFTALSNVTPSHLLDAELLLKSNQVKFSDQETLFDDEFLSSPDSSVQASQPIRVKTLI